MGVYRLIKNEELVDEQEGLSGDELGAMYD